MDIYEMLFLKMFKLGYPSIYKGFKMNYDYKYFQAEIVYFPTDKKLVKMWELMK